MRTVIVRVFEPVDGGDGRLRGSLERPGGRTVSFDGDDDLLATIRALVDDGTGGVVPPGGSSPHLAERRAR